MQGVRDDQRPVQPQHGRVVAVLDGLDAAELFDDAGEHWLPLVLCLADGELRGLKKGCRTAEFLSTPTDGRSPTSTRA
ncbi:hypothetical protein GCM10025862_34150 [Arsenicicoccus piscis]|uniref:Uncharacterized protein n=1 Tax=Arsenicicoccus piscis TaxID=673954 RepID=A0ABQ6HV41_9MICO|nr:hypothetical protein GCM10025862_34150 [Arsenicicoccus piscis]